MADLQLQIPQDVEQRLDDLFAPGDVAAGAEEHEVEVAERRHLPASGAAKANDGNSLAGGRIGIGVDPLDDQVVGKAHQLVRQEGIGCRDDAAPAWLGGQAPGDFGAA